MEIFNRNRYNDVLFLMPIHFSNEKLPRGKTRMLYCDAAGKVYTSLINNSVSKLAIENAKNMELTHRPFATLGLEISPGNYIPAAVEINTSDVRVLEHVLEHALKNGILPDVLKKYLKPIIKLGKDNRKALISEYEKQERQTPAEATPPVLERLPYYAEDNIEFSMPIYKARYSYPLIVLKNLTSDKNALKNPRRLLILDSDGDLAIIKAPGKLVDDMGKELSEQAIKNKKDVCAIILQDTKGMTVDYTPVSKLQRKALDALIKHFTETGSGKQPISNAARSVIVKAKNKVSPLI